MKLRPPNPKNLPDPKAGGTTAASGSRVYPSEGHPGLVSGLIRGLIGTAVLIGLPLVGVLTTREDLATYLEFPPLTRYVEHATFDPAAFIVLGALDLLMVLAILRLLSPATHLQAPSQTAQPKMRPFPHWGWLGIVILGSGWLLSWTRFDWFAPLQGHTFTIPWIGYILLVNALTVHRSGRCLINDRPGRFLLLWPASALFWWFFEYLNRFVQNWYYVGADDFSAMEYALHASLAFATVLPAVLSTQRLLLALPVFHRGLQSSVPIRLPRGRTAAVATLLFAATGLALIHPFSDYLYPLVWAAPLVVITSLQALWRRPTLFYELRHGDWRNIVTAAVAALICGFFWELWNYKSLARWEYAIPFVDRWHIFAMPLLGYGGYLPFGLECLLVGRWVFGDPEEAACAEFGSSPTTPA